MDKEIYEAIMKRCYDLGKAYTQLSRAELTLRRLLENFEEDDEIGKKLEGVHETLGFVLDNLEY